MRSLLILITILFISKEACSQDLIVSATGDSINCKILDTKSSFIFYKIKENGNYINKAIKKQSVVSVFPDFYPKNTPSELTTPQKKESHFRVAVGVGYVNLTDYFQKSGSPELDEIIKKMEMGMSFNFEVSNWITPQLGLGIKYSLYRSKNEGDVTFYRINNPSQTFKLKVVDVLMIHTLSPAIYFRPDIFKSNKNTLFLTASYERNYYDDAITYDTEGEQDIGKKWGQSFGVVFERRINSGASIGLSCKYSLGKIAEVKRSQNGHSNKIKLQGLDVINLNRLDIGVCISFN